MNQYKIKISVFLALSLFAFNSIAAINCTPSSADYIYNTNQEPTPKKVQSNGRIYFFSLPKDECKTSIFLIKDDKLLKYREVNGFSFVNYINKKGAVVDGWVRSEDVIADNEQHKGITYSDFSWKINGQNVNLLGKAIPELNIQNEIVTISQVNDILEKRLGFNDTYVSGITFIDSKYETARGVKVGDDWSKVTSKYGTISNLDSDDECRFYQYFDMKLRFCLDSSGKVQSISFENYPVK